MKKESESVIQQSIFRWFNNEYCLKNHKPRLIIHSVPNGIPVHLPPNEMSRALDLMLKTGMVNGVSDMIIQGVCGRIINIEVKNCIGIQSPAQKEIQKRIEELGGIYILVRNLESFQKEIKKHLVYLMNP